MVNKIESALNEVHAEYPDNIDYEKGAEILRTTAHKLVELGLFPAVVGEGGLVEVKSQKIDCGAFVFDKGRMQVLVEGKPIHLALKQLLLTSILVQNFDLVVPDRTIEEHVWGVNNLEHMGEGSLRVAVSSTNRQLRNGRTMPNPIVRVNRIGYKLINPLAPESNGS